MDDIQLILAAQNENGGPFWSREDRDIHAPSGFSTIDTLSVLGELGASLHQYPQLRDATDFVMTYQSPEGSFKYAPVSARLPCMTARILAALGRIGMTNDARLEKSYRWLSDTQWNDGGWRCNTVKLGKSPQTDASNPGTTLYVLDAFRFRDNTQELDSLNRGVAFLLKHWLIRQPMGPCLFGIGSRFLQIEYPFLRYNIFYYVYVLSFYQTARNDHRFQEAFNHLAGKVQHDQIVPEKPHKAWQHYAFARKGGSSVKATRRWMEIRDNLLK